MGRVILSEQSTPSTPDEGNRALYPKPDGKTYHLNDAGVEKELLDEDSGAVMDTDFTAADEVMVGTGAGTHAQVTLGASQVLGKKASGAIVNLTASDLRTIVNVEDGATADQTGAEIKSAYEGEADTNAYTDAEQTKVGYLTVTEATDLDTIRARVDELDAAVILIGGWDASAGTFPGAGAAQAGWSYIVTVAGTVDGEAFSVNDRLVAIIDDASTSTYASNWLKLDYSDVVASVAGLTGAIAAGDLRTAIDFANQARAAIGNIIGSDGKGDDDLDMDGHAIIGATSVSAGGKYALTGDASNSKQVIRRVYVEILNGTNATTIKVKTASRWNGDAITQEDNLGKSGDTGNFSLSADGKTLSIEAAAFSGSLIAILAVGVEQNASGTALSVLSYGTAIMEFYNAATGAGLDLTTLVDTGSIYLNMLYLTDE